MRKYLRSGWTHKVGKHIQTSIEKRFKIVTFEMMYQGLEKQGHFESGDRKTRKKASEVGEGDVGVTGRVTGEIDRLRKSAAYSSTSYDKDYAAKLLLSTTKVTTTNIRNSRKRYKSTTHSKQYQQGMYHHHIQLNKKARLCYGDVVWSYAPYRLC